jgi:D-alanyl-D-alanine carboxypeptidase
MIRLLLLSFLVLNVVSGCHRPAKSTANEAHGVQAILDSLVNVNQVPGVNYAIVFEDKTIKSYSSGYADVHQRILMTSEHVMFSGSVGKTYAVALLMQLLNEGLFALEDRIMDYFPDLDWMKMLPNIQDITIEMLLQHTSGLPRYVMKPEVWDTLHKNPDKVWSYHDRLKVIFNDDPLHEAGKGWDYSDTNYILVGMLIEKLSQKEYYDLVSARILIPEELTGTYASNRRDLPGLPVGYSDLPEWFKMPQEVVEDGIYAFNPQVEWTGGGMASTTTDLAKWARIYFTGKLFSNELLQKIITPNSQTKNLDPIMSYGMGSFIYKTNHGLAYAHTGFVPGFNSIFAHYPKLQVSVALQVNCDYASQKIPLIDYLDALLEESAK